MGRNLSERLGVRVALSLVLAVGTATCSSGESDDDPSSQATRTSVDVDSADSSPSATATPGTTEAPEATEAPGTAEAPSDDETTTTVAVPEPYRGPGDVHERPHTVNLMVSNQPLGYIHRESPQGLSSGAIGPDGRFYTTDSQGYGFVAIDEAGTVEDLGLWRDGWLDDGGPQGLAFDADGVLHVWAGERLLRVDASGSVEPLVENLPPMNRFAFGPDNTLYLADRETDSILAWIEGRQWRLVSDQVPAAEQMAFGPDGALYVGQERGQVFMRVDTETGDVEDYLYGLEVDDAPAPVIRFGDAGDLIFDPNGDIWVFGGDEGGRLFRMSADRRALPFRVDGRDYGEVPWLPIGACNGVRIDDQRRLWIPCFDGKIIRLDPQPGADYHYDSVQVRPGFQGTITVAPDDTIYATSFWAQQLVRFANGGPLEVVAEFDEQPWGVAVDLDGTVLVTLETRIVRVAPDGAVTAVTDVAANRVFVTPDGIMYAARRTGDVYDHREVVRIEADGTATPVFTTFQGQNLGTLELHLDLMYDGRLAVYDETQGNIFAIDADGTVEKLLDLKPLKAFEAGAFAASPTRPEFYVNIEDISQKFLYRIDLDGNAQLFAEGIAQDPLSADVSNDGGWLFMKELGAILVIEIPDGPVEPTEPNVLPTEAPPDVERPDATGPVDDVSDEDRAALCAAYLDFLAAAPPDRGGPLADIAAHVGAGAPAELIATIETLTTADYRSTDVRPQLNVLGDYLLPLCIDTYEAGVVPTADNSAAAEQFLTAVIEGDRALAKQVASELALVQFEPWDHLGIVRGFPRILESEDGFWIELTADMALQCEVSDGVVRTCHR